MIYRTIFWSLIAFILAMGIVGIVLTKPIPGIG
jgi:F0F1-type ATP synthase membrane subunit b/b'